MVGSLIDKKFARLRLLGEGAAAQVFEAAVIEECPYARIGDLVAIKAYKPWVLAQSGQSLRIERELVASTKVESEHIVKAYEVVKDEGGMFLVMELLPGTTLSKWMRENPLPNFASISQIIQDLAQAMFALHDNGLIHRDVKPDNVMITSRGSVLMDLGVVKDLTAETTMTHRQFLGTIRYAAPEYLFGESYDQQVDVYSLGAVLYELVFRKPVIEPELYWSRQILKAEESRESRSVPLFNAYIYSRLGFKESRFLGSLLQGTLVESDRLTSSQVLTSIVCRVWEKPFLHYVDRDVVTCWPNVPKELAGSVSEFMLEHPAVEVKALAKVLWNATCSWDNETVEFEESTPDLAARSARLARTLSSLGLITEHWSHDSPLTGKLTPLAWQLLLRGHFGSPTWNTANVASISYDANSQTLDVFFNDHTGNRYHRVPAHIYEDLINSGSEEQYFGSYIKGRYSYSGIIR